MNPPQNQTEKRCGERPLLAASPTLRLAGSTTKTSVTSALLGAMRKALSGDRALFPPSRMCRNHDGDSARCSIVPCQFGEEINDFARALDTMCLEAKNLGLACTVPLANVALPPAFHGKYGIIIHNK